MLGTGNVSVNYDPDWVATESVRMKTHLERVGQPVSDEATALWMERRSAGACPISPCCKQPKRGQVFCARHGDFERRHLTLLDFLQSDTPGQ